MHSTLTPYWMRLAYPVAGAVIGVWQANGWELLFPLVLMILLFGVFFTRAILVMSLARWEYLIRLELDWFTFVAAVACVRLFYGDATLVDALQWAGLWFSVALVMFWITFVARAIEQ